MAILSRRQEVCEIPQRWCGNGHVTYGFNIRNPQQIKRKMLSDFLGEKTLQRQGRLSSPARFNQIQMEGGGDKSNKTKMPIVFFYCY